MDFARERVFDAEAFDARTLADPAAALAHFRGALRDGEKQLEAHYLLIPIQDLVATRAWLVDQLITRAFARAARLAPPGCPVALAAVGGYGRGELQPGSDIDLMLLLDKTGAATIKPFAETLLQFLWDMGLEVGHSVRSLKDCVREAKRDVTVVTNLMEARLLAGDDALFARMQRDTGASKLWPAAAFFEAKRAEQVARHHRYGDTAYNLEPNVKEGPGGLRDIQMIDWVARRHFGARDLRELAARGVLSEHEYRVLLRARNFLWAVRAGLHYAAGRREDRLLFDHQRTLAARMGYRDAPGRLAVERFMKHYYRTVKAVALLNEVLLQYFEDAIQKRRRPRARPLNRRFHALGGLLEVAHPAVFARYPFAMLEMFLLLQQHPRLTGVGHATLRLLRANLHRINKAFRRDLAARSLFMEILRQPHGITHTLRRMNAYGVLGRYLPAFGRIVGQMQHDLFHVYTVDEHILFVVRNLRRFTVPAFEHEFPLASRIIRDVVKTERLYLAALFHDIAKGRGGDHSELGEAEARAFCRAHGLSDYDTNLVAWLVRNHLIMSATAQRQDISDPEVILRFAEHVGDQEHLDLLYLLTVADMRGTSPAVWNEWKGRLLAQLYADASRALRRGAGAPIDVEAHIADLKREALGLIGVRVPRDAVERHWARMDADYFLRHDAERLAWHARVIALADETRLPVVAARYHEPAGGSEFLVFTPDRDDLFAVLTAGFDRLNLSIWEARIHTTITGYALDTFVALDTDGKPIKDARALAQLEDALRRQLLDPKPGRDPHSTHVPRQLKHFPIATRVNFTTSRNGALTLIEVTAQDRPGLLYQVALALAECRTRLVTAKIATYGERAEDLFFVTERDGAPVTSPERLASLARAIEQRLAPGTVPPQIGVVEV